MFIIRKLIIVICLVASSINSLANTSVATTKLLNVQQIAQTPVIADNIIQKEQEKLWSLLLYRGTTANQNFLGVVSFHYSGIGETMYSTELAYTLSKYNFINRYIAPSATFQFAANIAERLSSQKNDRAFESDLYLVFRWKYFPWNHLITTTAAVGDGGSYTSHLLIGEKNDPGLSSGTTPADLQKLLNFFMLEATFAVPKYPEFQIVTRLNHRCTLFGFTSDSKQGSTNIGVGIRYYWG
jgi:hypothetical protein